MHHLAATGISEHHSNFHDFLWRGVLYADRFTPARLIVAPNVWVMPWSQLRNHLGRRCILSEIHNAMSDELSRPATATTITAVFYSQLAQLEHPTRSHGLNCRGWVCTVVVVQRPTLWQRDCDELAPSTLLNIYTRGSCREWDFVYYSQFAICNFLVKAIHILNPTTTKVPGILYRRVDK